MRAIFLDTDIIIDFLTNREPFSIEAAKLFEYSRRGDLKISVSSLSINNINYIVSRLESKRKAKKLINQLLPLVNILPVSSSTIEKSLLSRFKDFEDGLQNFCGEEGNIATFITRNIRDYSTSILSIQKPAEFLATIE